MEQSRPTTTVTSDSSGVGQGASNERFHGLQQVFEVPFK